MLSVETSKKVIKFLIPVFVAILSFSILSKQVPKASFINTSIDSIEESERTVERFTIAALSTSVAISFLPDDIGSSIANSLAEMDKYFIVILVALYVEKLMLTYGTAAAFKVVVPIGCGLIIAWMITKKDFLKKLAQKVFIFALAMILVVPCGTKLSDTICANYKEYVEEVITETESKSSTVTEIITTADEEQSVLDKISDAFKSAISSVTDLITYFKAVIKKCITAIAILILTTCVIPALTFIFFIWIIKQLFNISWNPAPVIKNVIETGKQSEEDKP